MNDDISDGIFWMVIAQWVTILLLAPLLALILWRVW